MIYEQVFNQIKKEFDEDTALRVCVLLSIHLTTDISKKDLKVQGRYAKKINKKFKIALWDYSEDEIELAIALEDCVHSWELRMIGLGGSKEKTFRELLELKNTNKQERE